MRRRISFCRLFADSHHSKVNYLIAACLLISSSIMLAYPSDSVGAIMFAFYLAGVSFAGQACEFRRSAVEIKR